MADKRYYWLQLQDNFFRQKEIKILRKIAGGDTYTIIYLKMMLMSLKDGGKIFYEGVANNLAEEVALEIDEDIENVEITIKYLMSKGLMICSETDGFMTDVPNLVGSETEVAKRVRKHRAAKEKLLQCNADVTICNGDIDIEKDIDIYIDTEEEPEPEPKKEPKHKLGEFGRVRLTKSESDRLIKELGQDTFNKCIKRLDEYIQETGKTYKDHNLTIRRWVIDAVKEKPKGKTNPKNSFNNIQERSYDYADLEKKLLGGN